MNRLELIAHQVAGECPHSQQAYKKISVEVRQATALGIIYMNSPKDLNALDSVMKEDIVAAVTALDRNPQVKVIVLLSRVPKAFCAGADIKEFKVSHGSYEQYLSDDVFKRICNALTQAVKPIVCGVNGLALGGGCELAMLCDVLLFREDARIGLPELNLGLIPGMGGTQRFPLLVGKYNAMKTVLTGEFITAAQLKQFGYDVYPTAQFEEEVLKVASNISKKSLSSLITAKRAITASTGMSLAEGMNFERSIFYPLVATKGAAEGVTAFVEKRKPDFKGI